MNDPTPSREPRVVVLGAGGLGCPALLGLSCAIEADRALGITIVDADRVERSNLHRQVLFTIADVGAAKAEAARFRLRTRRPDLNIDTVHQHVDAARLDAMLGALAPGSVVLECTDDPALKFAANDLCLHHDVPLVVAGVLGWQGQAMAVRRGAACYRCIFEAPPPPELAPACSEVGVMGSAAGVLGQLMALLALRLAAGEDAAGELIVADMRKTSVRTLRPAAREGCPACSDPDRKPQLSPTPARACATDV